MRRLKPTECQVYLDVNFIGNVLDISPKETVVCVEVGEIVVVPLCFASGRLVTTATTTVVVVYVIMQAMFGGGKLTS